MNKRGFTIVELLIVISIMGILLTLSVVNMRSSQANARDSERKADIESIAKSLEAYYTSGTDNSATYGSYPSTALTSSGADYMLQILRDISPESLKAPGVTDPSQTFISATNAIQTAAGVLPQPSANQYIYQPLRSDGTLCTPATGLIDTLVVGGGGGGSNGGSYGGGGGGGKVIYTPGQSVSGSIAVTVASGGAAQTYGDSSKFNSIEAKGGFGGVGTTGGVSGTDLNGGIGSNSSPTIGGGGGAGNLSAGQNSGTRNINYAGNGGTGTTSDISGSSINYGGGGGGAGGGATTYGVGLYGGGNGGYNTAGKYNGTSGTANTGGGGGGAVNSIGGSGGSGVVIVRYLTGTMQATGGTIIHSGSYTIHIFKTSGTFTVLSSNSECRKFNLYYHSEVDNTVHMVTSKRQ